MLINLAGIFLIIFIIWWFWIKKSKPVKALSDEINIVVKDGVYSPARIEVKTGQTVKLTFLREDPSPCAEKVIFDKMNITLDLPVNKKVSVSLKPEQPGEYSFTCQMKMYTGSLVVSE
ncbi:MAG: cupredoxin domain-containing protein [Gammaproteobacteria bacterium]|nr:cupredoxin domain-containing protein [Gammaproteobacteria bacterium]